MATQMNSPEDRYATLVQALLTAEAVSYAEHAVQSSRKFGSSALTIRNKIFAMLVKGQLVVKLPKQRVDALLAAGLGERFDPGHGRLMKEWFAVPPTSELDWLVLADEAMQFVTSKA